VRDLCVVIVTMAAEGSSAAAEELLAELSVFPSVPSIAFPVTTLQP